MAKTPSDKLFQLIKSLSPAEKRYFKVFIGDKNDLKYGRLFDLIDASEHFDDEKLRTKIYKGQSPDGKKYPELKSYLYDLIVKCLQFYDEQHSVEYRLNNILQGVAALYKRALYENCRELLFKAEKLASQYESFAHLLEIIKWEKQIAYTRMDVDFLQKNLELLHFKETQVLLQLKNITEYRQSFFLVYSIIKRGALQRGNEAMKKLEEQVSQPLFVDSSQALSHRARVLYFRTMNLYYYSAMERDLFYESGKTLIGLLESQAHFLRESLSDYIATLSNLMLACGMLNKNDEVRECLTKLKNLTPITEDDRHKIHRQYYTTKFLLCIFTGEFEEGKREIDNYHREALRFETREQETASFYFQYFCICFGCEDYEGALDYLNNWLRQPRTVEREDLQSTARILSLLVHLEMGNTMLLESLSRSATRYLQSKNRLFDLERRFIQFITEIIRVKSAKEKKAAFLKMQKDLEQLSQLPEVKVALQTFDLSSWIESKVKDTTFAEVVKEKASANKTSTI